jgi:uracil-DNA glycosylase
MGIADKIASCQECIYSERAGRIKTIDKPYVFFQVDKKWLPKQGVKVLFVAESPPWNGERRYFYNTLSIGKRAGLRKEVLRWLNLPSIEAFKEDGYFLIDAIKCRLNKKNYSSVPSEVLKKCSAKFLGEEIRIFRPETVFVLGNSAKKALENLQTTSGFLEFGDLQSHKVTEDYDKMLSGYRVILCVYPGGQTRAFESNIKRAFSKLTTKKTTSK